MQNVNVDNTEVKELDLLLVKAGDEVPRRTIVKDDNTVYVERTSKHDGTNASYRIHWTFDFSNCSREELLELATDSAVISYRKKGFRKVAESQLADACYQTVDVKSQIVDTERRGLTDAEKLKNLLLKMNPEEVEAILNPEG